MNSSNAGNTFNVDEIKRTLSDIGENFVKWIIQGDQTVQKETVLDASRQIHNIKSLLNDRKLLSEESKTVRQRKGEDLITPLLDSVGYLTMVIDNYLTKIMQKEQEENGHDLSFADMFQDDVEESENTSIIKQDSSTVKSILKTSNVDNSTRKKISFSGKATKVYQDNETSQISLARSSSTVKSSEKYDDVTSIFARNSDFNNPTSLETTNFFRPMLVNVPNTKQLNQEVGQIIPITYQTSFQEESPSIIESSFLNDSFPSSLANSTKNLKKFKHKTKNEKEIQNSISVNNGKQFKKEDTPDNFQAKPMDIDLENTDPQNPDDALLSSNLFSDELVKTFMSQIIEKDGEQNFSKTSENVSLPFHDFVLTLPGSNSSEESLDAKVRMAINISKGNVQNVNDANSGNRETIENTENETNWIWRPENSTEIIPSSEKFREGAFGWTQTLRENARDNCNTSDTSSFNISFLFDQTYEASWIPGGSTYQNHSKVYGDVAEVVTNRSPVEKEKGTIEHAKMKSNPMELYGGLRNPLQKHGRPQVEKCDGKISHEYFYEGDLYNTSKAIKVPPAAAKLRDTEKEDVPKTYTILDNAIHTSSKLQESGHEIVPPSNPASAAMNIFSGNALGDYQTSYVIDRSNKECSNPDVAIREVNRKNETSSPAIRPFDDQQHFDKAHGEKRLKLSLCDAANSKDLNSVKSHEPKVPEDPNKQVLKEQTLLIPTPNKVESTDQQYINLFSDLYKEPLKMGSIKTRGNSSNYDILKTCHSKQEPKEPQPHQPTQDVRETGKSKKLDSETSVDQVRDGMINIRNRFQETLLAGHWLKSGLQRNTTSSSFPSLKPLSDWEVNKQRNAMDENKILKAGSVDETRINPGTSVKLNVETNEVDRNFQEQNIQRVRMNTNVNKLTEISQSIQGNSMGHSLMNEKQRALWKPKTSTFSPLTLSDTDPVRKEELDTKRALQTDMIQGTTTNKTYCQDRRNLEDSSSNPPIIHEENTGTYNYGAILGQDNFATGNVDNRNNNLSFTLFAGDFLNPLQSNTSLHTTLHDIDSGKVKPNVNQSYLADKDENRYGSGRSRVTFTEVAPQYKGDGELAGYNYYETYVKQQGPNLTVGNRNDKPSSTQQTLITTSCATQDDSEVPLKTSSTENSKRQNNNSQNTKTMENSTSQCVKKPQIGRPKKKPPHKQNTSIAENVLTQNTLGPFSENLEKCTSSQKNSKSTRKKFVGRGSKASGHIVTRSSRERMDGVATDNAQNVKSLMDKAQTCNIRRRGRPSNGKAKPNSTFGVRRIKKKRKDEILSSSAMNNSGEKKAYLDNSSATEVWADSIDNDYFDFPNPNMSKDIEDNLYKCKPSNATITKGYCNRNSSADQQQQSEQMDMSFEECDDLYWNDLLNVINAEGNPSNWDGRSNVHEEEIGLESEHSTTYHGKPAGYISMTQLSWGQSATSGFSPISTQTNTTKQELKRNQGTFQSAESANAPNEETPAQYTTYPKTNSEIPIDYQSQTQLSWGQSATCGIPPETEAADSAQNTSATQPGKHTEFKLSFPPYLSVEADPELSFTKFMQDICGSSTEKVQESALLPLQTHKTEEEEIEEILNGIEFVRVPTASELIEASSIQELINDQSFIW